MLGLSNSSLFHGYCCAGVIRFRENDPCRPTVVWVIFAVRGFIFGFYFIQNVIARN